MKKYGISKLSLDKDKRIESFSVAEIDIKNRLVNSFESKERKWLVRQCLNGDTFVLLDKLKSGDWSEKSIISYDVNSDMFNWRYQIPKNVSSRKTFLSYYHKDDQFYKETFEKIFGDLIVNKSVQKGDIDSDNSDDYIKQLIQNNFLNDTTVLILLIGKNTKRRKHIDWEISGALNYKVGNHYAGLLGVVLPDHPDYGKAIKDRTYKNYPKRFVENYNSGYAVMVDWKEDRVLMQNEIEKAFQQRSNSDKIRNKTIPQMKTDTGN